MTVGTKTSFTAGDITGVEIRCKKCSTTVVIHPETIALDRFHTNWTCSGCGEVLIGASQESLVRDLVLSVLRAAQAPEATGHIALTVTAPEAGSP